jgi:hypothetical protein
VLIASGRTRLLKLDQLRGGAGHYEFSPHA